MNRGFKVNKKKYIKEDGTEFIGEVHEMPDGSLHTGKTHTKDSVQVFPSSMSKKLNSLMGSIEKLNYKLAENTYTKPSLREKLKNKIMAGSKGGKAGQWSARKAQLLAREYEKSGGGYKKGGKKEPQRSLSKWTREDWTTESGNPSTQGDKATGERYLPRKAIEKMSPQAYAATTKQKRKDLKSGKQFSKQTPKAKEISKGYR
jgi:hypothetical protein